MDGSPPSAPPPTMLAPGTVVGDWRVEAWAGRGVYGMVYRAVPLHDEHAPPVALKLALLPGDPRFAREVHVLSLFEHPSIPRLLGQGVWQAPGGTRHPYLVMQWVDGVPLYDHARLHPLSQEQVLRWLAQLADALAATGLAAVSMTAAVGMWLGARDESLREPAVAHVESEEEDSADAGTRGLGEVAAATSMEQAPAPSLQEKLAEEPLPEPQPGQTRPNAKGQCPRKGQIALNKGCWLETGSLDRDGCAEFNGQMYKLKLERLSLHAEGPARLRVRRDSRQCLLEAHELSQGITEVARRVLGEVLGKEHFAQVLEVFVFQSSNLEALRSLTHHMLRATGLDHALREAGA